MAIIVHGLMFGVWAFGHGGFGARYLLRVGLPTLSRAWRNGLQRCLTGITRSPIQTTSSIHGVSEAVLHRPYCAESWHGI